MMTLVSKCAKCGADLPADTPAGHCPVCLLGLGLSTLIEDDGSKKSRPRVSTPPPQGVSSRYFGDYELLEEIARGGMGIVYRARQMSLNRLVALKMILEGPLASPGFIERFQIEAQAAAKLNHPNIVPIFEIGEHQGRHFFSMKLIESGNLNQRLPSFGLPPGETAKTPAPHPNRADLQRRQRKIAALMATIARAVHHAHQRGTLHRDLKPANILIDSEGQPHVTDFGLAKLIEDDSLLTQTGALIGTPAYMAPEQAAGDGSQLTTATDIYGLGAILYHLLTAKPPFQAGTAVETMRQVIEEDPVPPVELNRAIHRDLSTICLKCLDKDPARRYTSARSLAEDLDRWQNGETILAVPSTRVSWLLRWCRRKPALAALLATVVVLLLTVTIQSMTDAIRIEKERQTAVAARKAATDKLWESYLAQARAQRWSGRPGRRFDSWDALVNAAQIRKSVELRNEAIACLGLTDLRPLPNPPAMDPNTTNVMVDWPRERFLQATGSGRTVFRSMQNGAVQSQLPQEGGGVVFINEISPDGRWASLKHADEMTRVWDLSRSRPIFQYSNVDATSISPDSRRIAVLVETNQLVIRDLAEGSPESIHDVPEMANGPRWSPNGKIIALPGLREVYFVDSTSGKVVRHVPLADQPMDLAWSPDGTRIATAGDDKIIYLWPIEASDRMIALKGHLGTVTAVKFSPDGTVLASDSWDGRLRLWDTRSGREMINVSAGPENIDFSPDGKRMAVYTRSQSQVELFEVAPCDSVVQLSDDVMPTHESGADALLFSPHENWIAASFGNSLQFRDVNSGGLLGQIENLPSGSLQWIAPSHEIFGLTINGFYRTRVETTDGKLSLSKPEPLRLEIPSGLKGQFSESFLKSSSASHTPVRTACSADARVTAAVFDNRCHVMDLKAGVLVTITGRQPGMKYVSVSPDGQWIATGGWHNLDVKVWSAKNGTEVVTLRTEASPNVCFSPDGKWLVTGTGKEYRFWRAGSWEPAHAVARPPFDDFPGPMAFSSDGKVLAVAYTRGTVHLVSPDDGHLLARIEPVPDNEIVTMAFNSDTSELAFTRVGADPEVWHLQKIRRQLASLGLDW